MTHSNSVKNYYIDFSMVDEETNAFLIENNIIKKEQEIIGTYIAEDNKIFLCFELKLKYYYEIGYIDSNDDFIVEYIIKANPGYKNAIFNYFNRYGILKIINKNEDYIKVDNVKIGYIYKIINNKNENNLNQNERHISTNNNDNSSSNQIKKEDNENKFVIDIFSILFSINSFKNNFKKNSEILTNNFFQSNSNNKNNLDNYFLINKQFLIQFKKLFQNDKLEHYLKKWEKETLSKIKENIVKKLNKNEFNDCKDFILSKKNDNVLKLTIEEILKIQKEKFKNDSGEYFYPKNFYILNKEVYPIILDVINKEKEDLNKDLLINAILKDEKIYFKYINNDAFNENTFFIYEYSLINNDELSLDYNFESILSFKDETEMNNYFDQINNKTNNYEIKDNTIKNLSGKVGIIIQKQKTDEENKENKNGEENVLGNKDNSNLNDKNEEKIKDFINNNIALYNGYSNLEKELKCSLSNKKAQTGYYLIHKKFMENLELEFDYKNIEKIIKEEKNEKIFSIK